MPPRRLNRLRGVEHACQGGRGGRVGDMGGYTMDDEWSVNNNKLWVRILLHRVRVGRIVAVGGASLRTCILQVQRVDAIGHRAVARRPTLAHFRRSERSVRQPAPLKERLQRVEASATFRAAAALRKADPGR